LFNLPQDVKKSPWEELQMEVDHYLERGNRSFRIVWKEDSPLTCAMLPYRTIRGQLHTGYFMANDQTFSLTFERRPKSYKLDCLPDKPVLFQSQQGLMVSVQRSDQSKFLAIISGTISGNNVTTTTGPRSPVTTAPTTSASVPTNSSESVLPANGTAKSRHGRAAVTDDADKGVSVASAGLLAARLQAVEFSTNKKLRELNAKLMQSQCNQYALTLGYSRSIFRTAPTLAAQIVFGRQDLKARAFANFLEIRECIPVHRFTFWQPKFADRLCYVKPPVVFQYGTRHFQGFLDTETLEIELAPPELKPCVSLSHYLLPRNNSVIAVDSNFTYFKKVKTLQIEDEIHDAEVGLFAVRPLVFRPLGDINISSLRSPITVTELYQQFETQQEVLQAVFKIQNQNNRVPWHRQLDAQEALDNLWKSTSFTWERIAANFWEKFVLIACCLVYIAAILILCNLSKVCVTGLVGRGRTYRLAVIRRDDAPEEEHPLSTRKKSRRRRRRSSSTSRSRSASPTRTKRKAPLPPSCSQVECGVTSAPPLYPTIQGDQSKIQKWPVAYANVISKRSTKTVIDLVCQDGVRARCMIDSGACINCIAPRLVTKLGLTAYPSEMTVKCAGGQTTKLKDKVDFAVHIKDDYRKITAYVLPAIPSEYDLLMGIEGFQAIGLQLRFDYTAKTVAFEDEVFPMVNSMAAEEQLQVVLPQAVEIPALSSVWIQAKITIPLATTEPVIFIPSCYTMQRYEIMLPSALLYPGRDGQTIGLQVSNMSLSTVKLYSQTRLGTIYDQSEFEPLQVNSVEVSNEDPSTIRAYILEQIDLKSSPVSQDQKERLIQLIMDNRDVFALLPNDAGRSTKFTAKIQTKPHSQPIAARPYNVAYSLRERFDELIQNLLDKGIIQPSESAYASPCLLVEKKGVDAQGRRQLRLVVDYRRLNELVISPAVRPPRIADLLHQLHDAKLFSTVDLKDGFFQLQLDPESFKYTAFITPDGLLYEFTRVPMGIKCAPSLMCRMISMLTSNSKNRVAYIDDILVMAPDFDAMMLELQALFSKMREHGLRMNLKKCEFIRKSVEYLGFVLSAAGIQPSTKLVAKIRSFPTPQNLKQLQSFLGLANFYRVHVKGYSAIVTPLLAIVRQVNRDKTFMWTSQAQAAFDKLKELLSERILLVHPDPHKPYILHTDASNTAIGAVLSQEDERRKLKPIAFISRTLMLSEQRYSVIERETLAIRWAVKKLHAFLYATLLPFIIYTDHQPLRTLLTNTQPNSRRLIKWILELQEYNFVVRYVKGSENAVADCLSRIPEINLLHPIPTMESFKEAQRQEPVLSAIGQLLREEPITVQLSKKQQTYVAKKGHRYCLQYDTLYFEDEQGSMVLAVPPQYRHAIIETMHDSKFAGHMGVAKTVQRIKRFYHWETIEQDVKRHIKGCEICHRAKPAARVVTTAKAVKFEDVFSTLAIDIVGPLPLASLLDNTYRYILTVQCCLSKFLFAIPLPVTNAQIICQTLFRHVFAIAGIPRQLISDNGPQFTSKEFRDFLDTLGIEIIYTSVYTPQSNPVERAHRTMKQTLTAYVSDHPELWLEYLPAVVLSLNTAVHTSTRETPFYLFFARDFFPPAERVLQRQATPTMETPPPHAIISSAIVLSREIAKHYLVLDSERRARSANSRRKPAKLREGGRCYLEASGPKASKFSNPFTGPYRLLRWATPQNAVIRLVNRPYDKPMVVHGSRLKQEPEYVGPDFEPALPQFREAQTQTHRDHRTEVERTTATQTEITRQRRRRQLASEEDTEPTGHRYQLRSKGPPGDPGGL
jgi:hypothetical protein